MNQESHPIELVVQKHPSGRWTLVARQGCEMFEQITGIRGERLCGNGDALSFYREVADYIGALSSMGARVLYQDVES